MKPIQISDSTKTTLIDQFKIYLDKTRLTDGKVEFSKKIDMPTTDNTKANIYITATAYLKMMLYVRDTATEIAWHGTVKRYSDKNAYLIKDVFLYPQILSGATVNTDQEEYNKWIEELNDETINTMRFQGHSHVNFAANPSDVDLNFYNDILQTLQKNDFYIFMILNKAGDTTFLIYDLEKNLIYENNDIEVHIIENNTNTDLEQAIDTDKQKYCTNPTKIESHTYGFLGNPYDDYDKYSGYNGFLSCPTRTTSKTTINNKFKNKTIKGKTK